MSAGGLRMSVPSAGVVGGGKGYGRGSRIESNPKAMILWDRDVFVPPRMDVGAGGRHLLGTQARARQISLVVSNAKHGGAQTVGISVSKEPSMVAHVENVSGGGALNQTGGALLVPYASEGGILLQEFPVALLHVQPAVETAVFHFRGDVPAVTSHGFGMTMAVEPGAAVTRSAVSDGESGGGTNFVKSKFDIGRFLGFPSLESHHSNQFSMMIMENIIWKEILSQERKDGLPKRNVGGKSQYEGFTDQVGVDKRTSLGRWEDIDEDFSDGDMEEGEVRVTPVHSAEPTQVLVVEPSRVLNADNIVESVQKGTELAELNMEDVGLETRMNYGDGSASILTSSLGQVEVLFDDVAAIDSRLAAQGGDFVEVGKRFPGGMGMQEGVHGGKRADGRMGDGVGEVKADHGDVMAGDEMVFEHI
ncbi:hypothetical protein NE237_031017 [Protea cynaroides]|uniref:Uncharacterized protein n=1 Tax=Protea cynaroides TaxID=273540 RepID=A0A9Q0JXH6_9MAGN|nr:hypothetical protein NE237_031017 [Protea cynaroides]